MRAANLTSLYDNKNYCSLARLGRSCSNREPTADEWIRSLNDDVWVTPTILIGDPKSPSVILREPSNDELDEAIGTP